MRRPRVKAQPRPRSGRLRNVPGHSSLNHFSSFSVFWRKKIASQRLMAGSSIVIGYGMIEEALLRCRLLPPTCKDSAVLHRLALCASILADAQFGSWPERPSRVSDAF